MSDPVRVYTQTAIGQEWLARYQGQRPLFACVLGFTQTGLIPGISAAGATPADRTQTAIADAEFLYYGPCPNPRYALPPLHVGISPAFISRAVVAAQTIPVRLFNAGLPIPPAAPHTNLGGAPARCVSQGQALDYVTVQHLFEQGLNWGETLAAQVPNRYLLLGECVVGGTTTALAVLMGLGCSAGGKVNSSHPACNHTQKLALVEAGLTHWRQSPPTGEPDPLRLVASVGDPMQIAVAGMAIAASRTCGVLLAGGTQMLAVYALIQALGRYYSLPWQVHNIVVGTTRWVAEDPTGDTVGLARMVGSVPLIATQANFSTASYAQLRAYEQNYVKEGVGAGGCAIAAYLHQNWHSADLLNAVETLVGQYARLAIQT